MKKLICLAFAFCFSVFVSYAQNDSTVVDRYDISPRDSIRRDELSYIADVVHPRFKMYQTENIYNLLKLDTMTGAIWQVQYEMNKDSEAMQVAIDSWPFVAARESHPGRFELYPTKNMYTFILLDTDTGNVYQVQWNTNPYKRFRTRIY